MPLLHFKKYGPSSLSEGDHYHAAAIAPESSEPATILPERRLIQLHLLKEIIS